MSKIWQEATVRLKMAKLGRLKFVEQALDAIDYVGSDFDGVVETIEYRQDGRTGILVGRDLWRQKQITNFGV